MKEEADETNEITAKRVRKTGRSKTELRVASFGK